MNNLRDLKSYIKSYAQDESGALTIVEVILLILAVLVIGGFVVSWIFDMIKSNTSLGTQKNNDFNNIINGIK